MACLHNHQNWHSCTARQPCWRENKFRNFFLPCCQWQQRSVDHFRKSTYTLQDPNKSFSDASLFFIPPEIELFAYPIRNNTPGTENKTPVAKSLADFLRSSIQFDSCHRLFVYNQAGLGNQVSRQAHHPKHRFEVIFDPGPDLDLDSNPNITPSMCHKESNHSLSHVATLSFRHIPYTSNPYFPLAVADPKN
jgi:hypothetical protein